MLCTLLCSGPALAGPDRLNDDVPDAFPDQKGAWNMTYGFQGLQLEGPLNSEQTAHHLFKLRYSFNPKVYGAIRYEQHDLAGGQGLLSPIYDNADSGDSLNFDLGINLMNVAAIPEDKAKGTPWAAGSSFGVGLGSSLISLDKGAVGESNTLVKAYLVYSTDLTEQMRAHTYFSSGRLTGDSASGSVNRIAAGLDYTFAANTCRPLVLMANGMLDVYNFRQPSFNTSRITRFDLGLRYRMAEDWYANLGWTTLNDSENDSSGSGLFASLNFVDEPPCCIPCLEAPEPPPAAPAAPADPAAAPKTSQAGPATGGLEYASASEGGSAPPLMAQSGAGTQRSDTPGSQTGGKYAAAATSLPDSNEPAESSDDGILIPEFPEEAPQATPERLLMARAPLPVDEADLAEDEVLLAALPQAESGKAASAVLPHLEDLAPEEGGEQRLLALGSGEKPMERQINAEKAASSDTSEDSEDADETGAKNDEKPAPGSGK